MYKLNLSNVNRTYIENYIKHTEYVKSHDFMGILVFTNVFIFISAIHESNYAIVPSIIFGALSIAVLGSWIYYLKFSKHTRKKYVLLFGIYCCLISFSFSLLSYMMLKDIFAGYSYIYLLVLLGAAVLVACLTFFIQVYLIKHDGYSSPRPPVASYIGTGIAAAATTRALSKYKVDLILVLGLCVGALGIAFAFGVSFLVKYKCYCILDNENDKSVL